MKIQAKDMFEVGSSASGKPVIKPIHAKAIKVILRIMERYGITLIQR